MGRGAVTGAALVAHRGIDMVGFTGGTRTGAAIMEAAGRQLKPCTMELGGKSANIIHESANFERALDGALAGIYSNNGQQCLAGSRILVQRSIAERFIEAFVNGRAAFASAIHCVAIHNSARCASRSHYDRVLSYVEVAKHDGAKLLTGGRPRAGVRQGLLHGADGSARPVQCGARLPGRDLRAVRHLSVYDTLDDAIAIANDSPYGLVGYVWAEDLQVAMRCSRDIRTGTFWVNTPMVRELRAPFGGYKQSGVGRDGATSSVEFFTELKSTIISDRSAGAVASRGRSGRERVRC